ncbi:uncharacterized protein [Asterias amurensis]|uniref:uncharacterized protein n=1 Tax=Asterias amurensis TaxID=7602 RepID=UPI003AB7C0D3
MPIFGKRHQKHNNRQISVESKQLSFSCGPLLNAHSQAKCSEKNVIMDVKKNVADNKSTQLHITSKDSQDGSITRIDKDAMVPQTLTPVCCNDPKRSRNPPKEGKKGH